MIPVLAQRLLVAQSVAADASQPSLASVDGLSGTFVPNPGLAVVSTEKLGLYSSTHFVRWSEGVIQGEVTIEVADESSYTGAWAPVAVVTFSGVAPKQDYAIVAGPFGAIRHRITQPVAGGSVTTKVIGTT